MRPRIGSRRGIVFERSVVAMTCAMSMAGAAAARAAQTNDAAATPIEQALVEFNCRVPGQTLANPEVHEECLRSQLIVLRGDFGPDLKKLSTAERRAIDKNCSEIRTLGGRDAYIACLAGQLTAARNKRAPALAAAPVVTPAAAAAMSAPVEVLPTDVTTLAAGAAVIPPPAPPQSSSAPLVLGTLALVALAGGGAWMWRSKRQPPPQLHVCRICGADVQEGDLCGTCRHDAAESQRRSLAERAEHQRRLAEDAKRAQEEADGRRQQQDDEAQRAEEAARVAALERQREVSKRREDDTRRWQETAAAAITDVSESSTFDPHAILGIAPTATEPEIRAAYDASREKYAAEQVSHLGQELQDRYRVKAAAVEKAFEMLTSQTRTA